MSDASQDPPGDDVDDLSDAALAAQLEEALAREARHEAADDELKADAARLAEIEDWYERGRDVGMDAEVLDAVADLLDHIDWQAAEIARLSAVSVALTQSSATTATAAQTKIDRLRHLAEHHETRARQAEARIVWLLSERARA